MKTIWSYIIVNLLGGPDSSWWWCCVLARWWGWSWSPSPRAGPGKSRCYLKIWKILVSVKLNKKLGCYKISFDGLIWRVVNIFRKTTKNVPRKNVKFCKSQNIYSRKFNIIWPLNFCNLIIGQLVSSRDGHRHWQVGGMHNTDLIPDIWSKGVKDWTFSKNRRQRSCLLPWSLSIVVDPDF